VKPSLVARPATDADRELGPKDAEGVRRLLGLFRIASASSSFTGSSEPWTSLFAWAAPFMKFAEAILVKSSVGESMLGLCIPLLGALGCMPFMRCIKGTPLLATKGKAKGGCGGGLPGPGKPWD